MSKETFKIKPNPLAIYVSELRIGNWLNFRHHKNDCPMPDFFWLPLTITAIKKDYVEVLDFESIPLTDDRVKPIPITEEWLLKFGFRKHKKGFSIGIADYGYVINFLDWRNDWTFGIEYYDPMDDKMIGEVFNFNGLGLQFVHQLQNLYFTLTGEELKTKEHASI